MNRQIAIYEVQVSFFPCTRIRAVLCIIYYGPGSALSLPIGSRMVQLETAIMSVPSDLALSISTLSLDMGMEKNIIERWPLTVFRMIIELV